MIPLLECHSCTQSPHYTSSTKRDDERGVSAPVELVGSVIMYVAHQLAPIYRGALSYF